MLHRRGGWRSGDGCCMGGGVVRVGVMSVAWEGMLSEKG